METRKTDAAKRERVQMRRRYFAAETAQIGPAEIVGDDDEIIGLVRRGAVLLAGAGLMWLERKEGAQRSNST